MVKRKFIDIDESRCNGCGQCVTSCAEGALQIIDGKARVVKEEFCDGLGACIGHCPMDALTIIEKDVAAFDEHAVEDHLKEREAKNMNIPCGCPGMATHDFRAGKEKKEESTANVPSQLQQWPVQLHLVNPVAPYFIGADVLIAATCTAFSYGNFHNDFIKDHSIAVACPKLDNTKGYVEKIIDLIDDAQINSITVVMMQVPCCGGLGQMVQMAMKKATRKVAYTEVILSLKGEVLSRKSI